MTLVAPTIDFTNILLEIGQSITIRKINRTIDSDGKVTSLTTTDTDTTAQVNEVSNKEKIWLQLGLVNVGDTYFNMSPSENITIYDQIIWNSTTFKITKVLIPPRINGQVLFKQVLCVQDSGSFPV
jgi:hypothetical protein